jgi:predicted negative regulator of RcsB-dependent stress response
MDSFIQQAIAVILSSGSPAVTALLLLLSGVIGWMSWKRETTHKQEREELLEKFQEQISEDRKDLLQVIDKYQAGQISVLQALNELRVLIATIGAKL